MTAQNAKPRAKATGGAPSKKKPKKKRPLGLAVYTEAQTVPRWITAARSVLLLAFVATVPVILGVTSGRRLFWAAAIPILPLLWVAGGYHLWRRICPLAVIAQLGRLLGRGGDRRIKGWVADNYMLVQLGFMVVALSLRLTMTNGTPWALAAFIGAATLMAIITGFLYTGKTWCNYICPVGMVEKIYTEPSRLSGPTNSQCKPCTACKKHCPDVDLEQGYWKEADAPARRAAYFAWPGIVLAFYAYFYFVAGNWDYYFTGAWTLEDSQLAHCVRPGLYFLQAVPVYIAAPLTLLTGGLVSYEVFSVGEKLALGRAETSDDNDRVRHRGRVLAGFVAFILFYFFGGQPTIRLAPTWIGTLFNVAVIAAATAMLMQRWNRREDDFVQERFVQKLLKRWQWGEVPETASPQDIFILHAERSKERETRVSTYKETVREMVADGIVSVGELAVLDTLRTQLGIAEKDHKKALTELSDEDQQLFDPDYQGSVELRLQQQAYRRDLERVVIAAARAGTSPEAEVLDSVRTEHNIDQSEHIAAVAHALSEDGPIAILFREQLDAIRGLADSSAVARMQPKSSSFDFARYVCRVRAVQRANYAARLLAPITQKTLEPDIISSASMGDADARSILESTLGEFGVALGEVLAALATGGSTDAAAGPAPFIALARDSASYARATAAQLLSRYDQQDANAALVELTEDLDPMVRESAYNALGVTGRMTRESIEIALGDSDERVRTAATIAASQARDDKELAAAMRTAARANARGVYATLDANAQVETLTTLETMMFLRQIPMFARLEPDDLESLAGLVSERRFDTGEPLCHEGEDGDTVFLVVTGEVVARKGEHILGHTGAGGCIGEIAVFDHEPRSATVEAVQPTRTLTIDGDPFRALLRERPSISEAVIEVLVGRVRSLIEAK